MYDYQTKNTKEVIRSHHKQTMVDKIQDKETSIQKINQPKQIRVNWGAPEG